MAEIHHGLTGSGHSTHQPTWWGNYRATVGLDDDGLISGSPAGGLAPWDGKNRQAWVLLHSTLAGHFPIIT